MFHEGPGASPGGAPGRIEVLGAARIHSDRMARVVRSAFAVVLAGGAVACSLASLDGYSDGARPAPEADAAPDVVSVTEDAAPDGTAADAGGDAPVPSFCSTKSVLFCSDFDDGTLPGPWSALEATGGATVVTNTQVSISSTPSLLVTFPGTTYSQGCLTRTISASSSKYTAEFDLFVESVGGTNFDIFTIDKSASRNVGVELYPNGKLGFDEDIPVVDGGPDEIRTAVDQVFPKGKWVHVKITVLVANGVGTVNLSVDGVVTPYAANQAIFTAPFGLTLGDCSLNMNGAEWRLRYDNFVFDTK
jgi:hypothetical protein